MNASMRSRKHQRGIVVLWAVIFLIVGVILTLTQVYDIAGSRGVATVQQSDSTAALFAAESGLQRASGIFSQAVANGNYTSSVCTSVTGGPYPVGTASFSYVGTPVSTPSGCTSAECTSCSLTVVGTSGSGSRTLSLNFDVETSLLGTNSCGTEPTLRLINTDAQYWGTALFNLSWRRQMASNEYAAGCPQGAGGNASVTICSGPNAPPTCYLRWNVESSSGNPSAGAMGVAADVGPGGSYTVKQTINTSRHYTLVGALLVGKSTATPPVVVGSYWDDVDSNGTGTVNNTGGGNQNNGETNSGVATTTGTCNTPPDATVANKAATEQTCTRWCGASDTLVFGISGRSGSFADEVPTSPGVRFNTGGPSGKNISMTRLNHFPNTSGNPSSTGDTFSEIWYAYNAQLADVTAGSFIVGRAYLIKFLGTTSFDTIGAASNTVGTVFTATGAGSGTGNATPHLALASSYKGNGSGAVGATWTGAGNTASGTTLTVGTFSGYPARILSVGDTISSSGGSGDITGSPTVVSQLSSTETGGALGGRGTYELSTSQAVTDVAGRNWTANSAVLNVSQCVICYFDAGDSIIGSFVSNKTINSQLTPLRPGEALGGIGRYQLNSSGSPSLPTSVASANTLRAGTPGATLYQPANEGMPVAGAKIAFFSGTGTLDANTHTVVTSVTSPAPNTATNAYTVSPAPTTALNTANLCAGTCAFFNNPSSTTSTTEFQISKTGGVAQWASGFTCVSGVDSTKITPVYAVSSLKPKTWTEVVQP